MIDIGSGLGGLLIRAAAARADIQFTGIELAPLPWLFSAMRNRHGNCRFLHGDYDRLDFSHYDVVFAYLSTAAMPSLWHKAAREMRAGTLLLSYEFAIPGVNPSFTSVLEPSAAVLYGWRM